MPSETLPPTRRIRDCCPKSEPMKRLKENAVKRAQSIKKRRKLELVEDLLRQHCAGMWSDSEEDTKASCTSLPVHVRDDHEDAVNQDETDESNSTRLPFPSQPQKRKGIDVGNPRKLTAAAATSASPEDVTRPELQRRKHQGANADNANVKPFCCDREREQQGFRADIRPLERQVKGREEWVSMRKGSLARSRAAKRAENSVPAHIVCAEQGGASHSRSLHLLRKLGGLSPSGESKEATDTARGMDSKGHSNGPGRDKELQAELQKEFDATVHDIRNLVYPHLGRFQRRQFVAASLRALGIAPNKTQKMPLPELRSRKKATTAALRARWAEAKVLGVRSHIDDQGSLQQASRNRSKLSAQVTRRKHLREIFKHAGKHRSRGVRTSTG
ncbi:uncharacterized protein LOC34622584 [Cyclospora cayetanensis]|uniref:Uncharacterized protein LOC34622584 n=1 Tax=Cyclospora cayetanensis TaxID=88456 RepID=A0A6P6S154_9EIME|nr:uncharacterized protein LOC34622584 [Cyclospora cayetanensis]